MARLLLLRSVSCCKARPSTSPASRRAGLEVIRGTCSTHACTLFDFQIHGAIGCSARACLCVGDGDMWMPQGRQVFGDNEGGGKPPNTY